MLGDDACSSQINRIGLVRCEYSVSSDIPQHFKTNNNVPLGSNIKITELDTDNAVSYSGSLAKKNNSRPEMFDVSQISNPCAELKEARENRRCSDRLQQKMASSNNIAEKMNRHNDHAGKKRSAAGIIQNTNSFSCLDTKGTIARSKGRG